MKVLRSKKLPALLAALVVGGTVAAVALPRVVQQQRREPLHVRTRLGEALQFGEEGRFPRLGLGQLPARADLPGRDVGAQLRQVGPASEKVVDARPQDGKLLTSLFEGEHAA